MKRWAYWCTPNYFPTADDRRRPRGRWENPTPGGMEAGLDTGPVYMAEWRLAGHEILLVDSPARHDFTFTPSTSLFIEFSDAGAQRAAYDALSEGGQVMMPLDDYGFSQRFGWVADRFGVSWQLNLA